MAAEDGECDDDCPCHVDGTAEEASASSERATAPGGQAGCGREDVPCGGESD